MNTTDAVAVLRAHNKWRRAEAPEIPDGIPDSSPPHSARDIGIAIDVLCDKIERLEPKPMTGAEVMEWLAPNASLSRGGEADFGLKRELGERT